MKRVTIAREIPINDFEKFKKVIEEGKGPAWVDQKVKSLLGANPIRLPSGSNLSTFLSGLLVGHCELYEQPGGAILYNEIDSLRFHGYIGNLVLIGFQEDNLVYQKLKGELEKLASGNPDGFPKTFEDFYVGVPPSVYDEVLAKLEALENKASEL